MQQETLLEFEELIGQRVYVHYNLHKHQLSVSQKGKVIAYLENITLTDVTFRVRQGGYQRFVKEGTKNVHAFVVGTVIDKVPKQCTTSIYYDPHMFNFFHDRKNNKVEKSKYCEIIDKRIYVTRNIK